MSSPVEPDPRIEPVVPVHGDMLAPPADVAAARLDVDVEESRATSSSDLESSTVDRTKAAAGDAAQATSEQAKNVASTAASQARSVLDEAKGQVSGLVDQAKDELQAQAESRGAQAAGSLRTLSDQLGALAGGNPDAAGPLAGYLQEAQGRISDVATRLDQRGLQGAVDDLAGFARRRPGLFLLGAAGAGFLAGRLVRSGVSVSRSDSASSTTDPLELPPPAPLAARTQVP